MADSVEIKRRFVELRGKGKSYRSISEELGVSERSLVRWSRELANEIANQRKLEYEKLREEYLLNREQRIRIAGSQLGKITEELLKRDFSNVSTYHLFYMQQKLTKEFCDQETEMHFVEEISLIGEDNLRKLNTKEVKWKG